MKNLKQLAVLSIGFTLTLGACSKGGSDAPAPGSSGTYASLSKAYEEVAPKAKIVDIDAAAGGSFYGNSGTRYLFPANAFQTATGATVAGYVKIEVLECITESDMIFSKMLPMSNGEALKSGGEFSIKASQEGKAIYLRPGMKYEIKAPTHKGSETADMNYYSGNLSSAVLGTTVNWNLRLSDTTARIVYEGDTIKMLPDSVGFMNIDKVSGYGQSFVDVKIAGVSGLLNQTDFNAYYIVENTLGAISLYSQTKAFSDNMYKSATIAKANAHYVVCAVYKGEFYGGILKDITAITGSTYTITIAKTTPKAFKAQIDLLK